MTTMTREQILESQLKAISYALNRKEEQLTDKRTKLINAYVLINKLHERIDSLSAELTQSGKMHEQLDNDIVSYRERLDKLTTDNHCLSAELDNVLTDKLYQTMRAERLERQMVGLHNALRELVIDNESDLLEHSE